MSVFSFDNLNLPSVMFGIVICVFVIFLVLAAKSGIPYAWNAVRSWYDDANSELQQALSAIEGRVSQLEQNTSAVSGLADRVKTLEGNVSTLASKVP